MANRLDISVIIPTYNRPHIIKDLLEHWLKVKRVSKYLFELVFADDGSDDGTYDFLSSQKMILARVVPGGHRGAAHARNKAFRVAEGERVLFLGDDISPLQTSSTDTVLYQTGFHRILRSSGK